MKKYFTLVLFTHLCVNNHLFSQNIAVNSTGSLPDTSAMLDVSSTNKGFLAPRMTTTQQNAIPLPAKGLIIFNTTDNGLKLNTGTPASPVWTAIGSGGGSTTNTLGSSSNTLTSTVNGVAATATLVNTVSNSSANNVLSTTVNGVTGSGVSIVNSISNTVSGNNLSTTVNGVTGANVNLVNTNVLALSGSTLTSTINGQASNGLSLSPLLTSATTNTLNSSVNTLSNTTNGVTATAPIVNSNALALSGSTLTSTINGVASNGLSLSPLLASATTNTLGSSVNTMTNTTNGVSATAPIVNSNALALSGSTLTSTINGVASNGLSLSPLLAAATTNTLSSSVNTLTNTTNGVSATASIINTNSLSLSGNTLTSTVNGVTSAGVVLPIPGAFTLNGLTPTTQTFATGTTGSDFNIASSGSTHTFNIPDASASARGLISTGAQTIAGAKTFTGNTTVSGTLTGSNTVTFSALTSGAATDSVVTIDASGNLKRRNISAFTGNDWSISGNSNITSSNFIGTTNSNSLRFRTNNTERMVIDASGNTGIGITDPAAQLVVKDNVEIRRTGTVSQLLFTNTAGTGDFRFGGDGGDIYWQGGGGRNLQMGSFWATVLVGDRQTAAFPAFQNGITGTSILVSSARDASVPLGVQAFSSSQSANLTEWRNALGTVLSSVDESGNIGAGTAAPNSTLEVNGTVAVKLFTSSGNSAITLGSSASIYYISSNVSSISFPSASSCANRIYTIVNRTNGSRSTSNYTSLTGTTASSIASNTSIQIISDGSNWLQIR